MATAISVSPVKPRWIRVKDGPDHDGQGRAWFAMEFEGGLPAGRWIGLRYRTSLLGDVQRAFLRLRSRDAERHHPIPGGLFGRAEWIGYLPPDIKEVAVSPAIVHTPSYEVLSIAAVLARSLVQNRALALYAMRHWLAGRHTDALNELQVACSSTLLSDYHRWRAHSWREPDPEGLDRLPESARTMPHIRAIIDRATAPADAVETTLASLDRQFYAHRSVKVATHGPPAGPDLLAGLNDRDVVTVLRAGDVLPPYAFAAVAQYLAAHPDADLVYGDEESLDGRGRYINPELKPDWSPIFQDRRAYVGRAVYRRRDLVVASPEALWPAVNGRTKSVGHIRRILLSKVAGDVAVKAPGCRPSLAIDRATKTLSTIVIPSKDRPDLLLACLSSLRPTEAPFEVLIIDNGGEYPANPAECRSAVGDRPTRILPLPGPFNFSRLCNEAAAAAQGDVLVFLNDDTVVTQADWLSRLLVWATRAECGAIGPKLLYPSGKVQHGGIVVGLGGYAAHIESGAPGADPGYCGRLDVTHEVSAVTGACLVVEKAKFDAVGGFDVEEFPIELGDVDLCLRLESRGWKTVLVPEVSLVHRESTSRGHATDRHVRYAWEHAHFAARWHGRMRDDPFFHPALSLASLRTRLDG
jgi:GT2 family glycosyltransferase